jgi:phosphatidylglycerol---prolipoprotein diacylglyceryl transferase
MHPILFDFGVHDVAGFPLRLAIGSYGVAMLLAMTVALAWAGREGRRRWPQVPMATLVLAMLTAGLLGAKVFAALEQLPALLSGASSPAPLLTAGGSWLPGALCGFTVGWLWLRRARVPVGEAVNLLAVVVPLAHAIGRLGCLLAGCCHGRPTDLPWGLVYRDPHAAELNATPLGVPLHPVPLYEAGLELVSFALCWQLYRRHPRPWAVLAAWAGLYGAERFFVELLRGDARSFVAGLSTSQWLGLGMAVASAIFFLSPRPLSARRGPAAAAQGA